MKKLFFLIILCCATTTTPAHKLSYNEQDPFSTRMLFLFFDTSETINFTNQTVPPVTHDVITAISEQLPFVATPNLLHNALTYLSIYHDANRTTLQNFITKYPKAPHTLYNALKKLKLVMEYLQQELIHPHKTLHNDKKTNAILHLEHVWSFSQNFKTFLHNNSIRPNELQNYWHLFLYSTIDYQPHDWIIKKLNETLYLYVPKNKYPTLLNTYHAVQNQDISSYTTLELQLGLSIDHLSNVLPDLFQNILAPTDTIEFIPEKLFVPLDAYKNSAFTPQSWSFYLSAHGSAPQSIAPQLKESEKKIRDLWKHIKSFDDPFNSFVFPPPESTTIIQKALDFIQQKNYLACSKTLTALLLILPVLTLKPSIKKALTDNCNDFISIIKSNAKNNAKLYTLLNVLLQDLHTLSIDIENINNNSLYIQQYLTHAQQLKKLQQQGISTFNQIGTLDTFILHSLFTFFNNKLDTRCVMLNACYSGSETFITLQKNLETLSDYNFIFIVQGITDSMTLASSVVFMVPSIPSCYIDNSLKITFTPSQPYKQLFTALTQKVPWPSIQNITKILSQDSLHPQNIIQYKQPHLAWSTIALEPNITVTLQKILVDNHSGPLNISTFFGKETYDPLTKTIKKHKAYPKNIIINAPEIPFPLVFERKEKQAFPTIIAAKPLNTMQYIARLDAPHFTLEEILKGFFALGPTIASEKIWYIDEIKAQDMTITKVRIAMHAQLANIQEPINVILYQDPHSKNIMHEFWYTKNPLPQHLTFSQTTEKDYTTLDTHIQNKGYFIQKTVQSSQKNIIEEVLQKKLTLSSSFTATSDTTHYTKQAHHDLAIITESLYS